MEKMMNFIETMLLILLSITSVAGIISLIYGSRVEAMVNESLEPFEMVIESKLPETSFSMLSKQKEKVIHILQKFTRSLMRFLFGKVIKFSHRLCVKNIMSIMPSSLQCAKANQASMTKQSVTPGRAKG